MGMMARFLHRGDVLEVDGGRYMVAEGFVPPTSRRNRTFGPAFDWGQQVVREEEENLTWRIPIFVTADNEAEAQRAIEQLQGFLNRAGDEGEPLFFGWRAWDDYDYEPVHGTFGKLKRYELVNAEIVLPDNFFTIFTSYTVGACQVEVTSKPDDWLRILAGIGAGSIFEEIYKTPNGVSRGVRLNAAMTNYFTNPVFEGATWNTGWTAGADLYEDQNTDPRYTLFGRSSLRLVYDGTAGGGTADCYLQSCTPGSTNAMVIGVFVKKVDGVAIESSDFFFVKGSTSIIGMNVLDVGDGWWWCWVATTGTVGASDYGVRLSTAGRYLYFDGFQLEYGSFPTFLCYGDQVGAAWSGTPNASTSARTSGSLKWPRKLLMPAYAESTIRVVWKPDWAGRYVGVGANVYLYSDGILEVGYDGTNNRFFATDGTQTVHTTSTLLGNNTIYTLHFTFDASNGLALYLNGVLKDTDATYTIPPLASAGDYARLGANAGGNLAQGTFYGFAVFDREMTAAAVLADYNQLAALLAGDERVDEIPWFWTMNGSGEIYNQNDTSQGNYLVAGGFGGEEVTPEMIATLSASLATVGEIHFGRLAVDQRDFAQHIPGIEGNVRSLLFQDESGTADVGNSSGDAYQNRTLSTTAVALSLFATLYSRQNSYFSGKPVRVMGRVRDAGGGASANLQVALRYYFGTLTHDTDFRNLPALGTANFGLVEYGQATFPPSARVRHERAQTDWIFVVPLVKRATGSSAFYSDYIVYLPYPLRVKDLAGSTHTDFVLRGQYARSVSPTWVLGQAEINLVDILETRGWPLMFEGGKLNLVNLVMGEANGADGALITWTLTVKELWLTIRHRLG